MVEVLLIVGIAVAVFVGINIGGSSTGVAFGPAVGSNVTTKSIAALLMSVFALIGGGTIGRGVIKTMGGRIAPANQFNLEAGVIILFFIGLALLISNLFGVPASTSMTAVGAIAGMGFAGDFLNWKQMGEIVSWWFISPIIAFWLSAVIGRYFYPYLSVRFQIERSEEPLLKWRDILLLKIPIGFSDETTKNELFTSILVVVIGCYMAFSAGASNVANAVAPLYGANALGSEFTLYVVLGGGAISVGAFTIASRTLETIGSDLTDLPLLAALIVEIISATLISFLSYIEIPASLAVTLTMCVVGLGWGRATRSTAVTDIAGKAMSNTKDSINPTPKDESNSFAQTNWKMETGHNEEERELVGNQHSTTNNPLTADQPEKEITPIGTNNDDLQTSDLFDPKATSRVITLWMLTPTISSTASYILFTLVPLYG